MPRRTALQRLGLRGSTPDRDRHGISLTASASVIDLRDRSEGTRLAGRNTRQGWQTDAWTYRRNIGEVRYLQDWLGVAVSQMTLHPAWLIPGQDDPTPLPATPDDGLPDDLPAGLLADAHHALRQLGDPGPLLHRATVNLEVAGECYLVGYTDENDRERWEVRSIDELTLTDDGWLLLDGPLTAGARNRTGTRPVSTRQGGPLLDPDDSYVARIWRPDAQWTGLADSPMSSVLGECETLLLLTRKVRGGARSRLGAGLLLIPSELDFVDSVDPISGEPVPAEPVDQMLLRAMSTAIGDESSASAVVPVTLKGPADVLGAIRLVDVGRDPDPNDRAERAEALTRLLQGLDAPPEVVTGFKDVKYANARAIDEGSFRYNVEPKVLTLVHALTTAYLRPRLRAAGWADDVLDRLIVWYDPSRLVTNPDQGSNAQAVFDAGELSGAALRRHRGFDETDAPTAEERAARGLSPAGSGTPEPEPVPSGRPVDVPELTAAAGEVEPTPVPLGARLLRADLDLFGWLSGAADAAMRRALERAGARVRSKTRSGAYADRTRDVPQARLVAEIGPAGLAELGLTVEQLLEGGPFDALAVAFLSRAERAFETGLRLTADTLGLRYWPPGTPDPGMVAAGPLDVRFSDLGGLDMLTLREAAERSRTHAAERLVRRLTELAADRLYLPDPPAGQGETDPDLTVPAGLLREAVALAGGEGAPGTAGVDPNGRPLTDGALPGGAAASRLLLDAAADAGLPRYAYAWSHGTTASPFDPHLALDGYVFTTTADSRLRKPPGAWPYDTAGYYPGDHAGCTCWTEHLFTDPFAGLTPAEARRVRAAQKTRDVRGRFLPGTAPSPLPEGTS